MSKTPTTPTARPDAEKAPSVATEIIVRRVKNGFTLDIDYRDDGDSWDRDEMTVHHTPAAVLDAVTKALIPQPKPAKVKKSAA